MPDIFDEVDEDLRGERIRSLLVRYGGALIAAALLVVAGVGAWQAWRYYGSRQAAVTAKVFLDATNKADGQPGPARQEALPGLAEVAKSGNAGYRTLARLRQAELLDKAGDANGAASLRLAVADDSSADKLLRDLAALQWSTHAIDSGDPAQVTARLIPLARPDNPYHALALEAQALLALRQGNADSARNTLKRLSEDSTAPQGVRQRAGAILAQIGPAPPEADKKTGGAGGS